MICDRCLLKTPATDRLRDYDPHSVGRGDLQLNGAGESRATPDVILGRPLTSLVEVKSIIRHHAPIAALIGFVLQPGTDFFAPFANANRFIVEAVEPGAGMKAIGHPTITQVGIAVEIRHVHIGGGAVVPRGHFGEGDGVARIALGGTTHLELNVSGVAIVRLGPVRFDVIVRAANDQQIGGGDGMTFDRGQIEFEIGGLFIGVLHGISDLIIGTGADTGTIPVAAVEATQVVNGCLGADRAQPKQREGG